MLPRLKVSCAYDGGAIGASRQMVDALRKVRTEVRLAILPNLQEQNLWFPYYTDPELVSWLLRHRRSSPQERKELDERIARDSATPRPQKPGSYTYNFNVRADNKPIALSCRLTQRIE